MTESFNKLKEEVYKRYPDINIDFDNIPEEFKLSFLRSVIAKKVYEEYKNEFIEKFKDKSSKSGRSIMGFVNSGIKGNCFERNGKKVCAEGQKPSSIDFDNAISNLSDDGIVTQFWLDKGEYDKNNCYRSDATGSCDIPEDLEEVEFHIVESKPDDSMISNTVTFKDENFEKNTHKKTTVHLYGNYSDFGGNDYSLNMTLTLNEESQTMSDAKYRDKKNDYLTRIDYHGGVVPPTPYDDADNREIYVKEHGVTVKGYFHKGNNE